MILTPENSEAAATQPSTAIVLSAPTGSHPPDKNPALAYLLGLSTLKGRRTQASALKTIAALMDSTPAALAWGDLDYVRTSAIRAVVAERFAPATANRFLAALRGTLLEARRLGLMTPEQHALASDIRPIKGSRLPAGRALTVAEIRRLLRAAAKDPRAGRRDAALVALLYVAGLRRSEAVGLDLADFRAADGTLVVMGKGNKQRVAYVAAAREHFDAWLAERGPEPGPCFLPINKGGRREMRRMSDHAVLGILNRLATRAGVEPFGAHDLRRSCVSALLDAGADLSAVQAIAGHASVATTARYDRRGEAAARKAAGLLKM